MLTSIINQFMISILIMIGQFSNYDTHHIIHQQELPKLIIAGELIKNYCGSDNHLGCYSAPSNVIVVKKLRPQNNFDYAVLAHELFHYVQWHNHKRSRLEPETYRFEKRFHSMLKQKRFVLSDKHITDELINTYKSKVF